MLDDAIHLYRRFCAGEPGTCIFTGQDGCHAFVTEDEIEAAYGSRHDTRHFVWLDKPADAQKRVPPDAIDGLPMALRASIERFAAWVVDRAERQKRTDEILNQEFADFARDKGKLQ